MKIWIALATTVMVTACSDGPAALSQAHGRMPVLETTVDCAYWSCESQVCGHNTEVYGACCTQEAIPPYDPSYPEPSCSGGVPTDTLPHGPNHGSWGQCTSDSNTSECPTSWEVTSETYLERVCNEFSCPIQCASCRYP